MGNSNKMIDKLEAERELFYKTVRRNNKADRLYAKPDDVPLTAEEISEIDRYWGKYKFAYPDIDYKSFEIFKNRFGYFDVRHCPNAIRMCYFQQHLINKKYVSPFRNKALMEYFYPDLPKPRTIARRMCGIYYDENYMPISLEQLIEICCAHVREKGNLIVKPGGEHGGTGITFLNQENATPSHILEILTSEIMQNMSVVIQEVLKQSPFMDAFNSSSVNTVRIVTFLIHGKITPLAAEIRIGEKGSGVDNWHSGGALLGVDIESGRCNRWALSQKLEHITVLPSGIDLEAQELIVPNFDKLKESVVRAHYRLPYMKTIFWDIALDQNDIPIFIECNFTGAIQGLQATSGPIFGKYMDELLDEYLLKKFYIRFATEDFICKEYHDHIEIETYAGDDGMVVVPDTMRDKPVTKISAKAFEGRTVNNISASLAMLKKVKKAIASSKS